MKTKFLSFVLVLTFVLAACSPAATPTAAPPTLPPPTEAPTEPPASAVPFPSGHFTAVNNKDEGYEFRTDGVFEYFFGSGMDPLFEGVYSVNGNQVTIENPKETDAKCKGGATYTWSYDKGNLTFFPVGEDACQPRKESLSQTYAHNVSYIPEMTISARDYDYVAPKSIRSGWVRVTLKNVGTEPHHVQFLRLNDGVTAAQFEEALKQGEGPALAMTQQYGGVGAIAPGMSATAVLNLPAGEYVILCLIPSPSDGTAHHAKGMIKTMTVRAEDGHGNEPSADMTVRLQDFTFEMLDVLPAGPVSIQLTNGGPEAHEFNILKLEDGKTAADVMAFLNGQVAGPPPFIPVGGANGIDVGLTEYAELNLEPGNYVAICNIPSPKSEGHPHFALGMIKEFTVK